MLQRVKLTIEYDGTNFYGWQRQQNLPTIQEEIEKSLEKFFNRKINVFVAGRTDAGVHAHGQVAHFDFERDINNISHSEYKICCALNSLLRPHPISIINAEFVDENFHARFSAKQKSYIYKIINRRSPTTINKNYSWQIFSQLDMEKFKDCAQYFIGYKDFSSFCGPDNQSHTTFRTIENVIIEKQGDEIFVEFLGKSFLHNQIRIMVGTIKKITLDTNISNIEQEMKKIFAAKNRNKAGETAPARGLFLNRIEFY